MNSIDLTSLHKEYQLLIDDLKIQIINRLEKYSFSLFREGNLKNPFSPECVLDNPRLQSDHMYDVGRFEIANRVLADFEYLIAYEIREKY